MKYGGGLALVVSWAVLAAGTGLADVSQWRNAGPDKLGVGGFLTFDPQDPNTIYTGTSVGLFKSTDGGATWNNAGLIGWPVASLVVDPQNSSTLYAVTSTKNVFRSADGGATWKEADSGLPTTQDGVIFLRIAPQNTATLYALVAGAQPQLFWTTDAGANWTPASGLPGRLRFVDVEIDPQNSSTLYAAAQGVDNAGHPLVGLFKSKDAGASWNQADSGLLDVGTGNNIPPFVPGGAITVDPRNPATLYATRFGIGVYKSTDGAASWRAANSGLPNQIGEYEFMSCCISGLIIDPRNSETLYAFGSFYGVIFKSTNGGANWRATSQLGGGTTTGPLTIDPHTGALYTPPLYGGKVVLESADGAAPWNVLYFSLRDIPVAALALDPQNAGTIYAGGFKSADAGMSWNSTNMSFGASLAALAIDPQSPGTVYAGISVTTVDDGDFVPCSASSASGIFKSIDGGANWVDTVAGFGCLSAIVVDPQNSSTVYAASQHNGVYKSTDRGTSWGALNSGLPLGPMGISISTLAVDSRDSGILYAAIASGGLFKTVNGGATWSGAGLAPASYSLAIDPQNSSAVYAATASGLFSSPDGGATWQNLFSSSPTYAVAISPRSSGTIYCGTDSGVVQSSDGGGSWTPIAGGPSFVRLLALDPQAPNTVYAGGPGGLFRISVDPPGPGANRAR